MAKFGLFHFFGPGNPDLISFDVGLNFSKILRAVLELSKDTFSTTRLSLNFLAHGINRTMQKMALHFICRQKKSYA